jgi:predicted nucleic acid-binding protein
VTEIGIPDGERVLIDTPAFIYFLEQHPRYHPLAEELFRRVEAGRLSACASVLVLTELLVPYYRNSDLARAAGLSAAVRSIDNLSVFPVSAPAAERAALLRAKYGVRTPDAVHVATGLLQGARWLVTNDAALKRLSAENLTVWLFDEHL